MGKLKKRLFELAKLARKIVPSLEKIILLGDNEGMIIDADTLEYIKRRSKVWYDTNIGGCSLDDCTKFFETEDFSLLEAYNNKYGYKTKGRQFYIDEGEKEVKWLTPQEVQNLLNQD
jgi:hypothetical protein